MYLDTTYVAKFYLNEPESRQIRTMVEEAGVIHSSVWALAEFHCVLHRRMREGTTSLHDARQLSVLFSEHARDGLWNLVPVRESLLRRTGALVIAAPADLFIRTADAVHLATAQDLGEREIWTNDRHMLAAASHFGLIGRSV